MPNESHLHADHAAETHPSPAEVGVGYEVRDTRVTPIVVFIVGLFLFLVVAQLALWGMIKAVTGDTQGPAVTSKSADTVLYEQLRALRKVEEARKTKIDHAMDLLARRGIPATSGPPVTEIELNSHAGTPAPIDPSKGMGVGIAIGKDKRINDNQGKDLPVRPGPLP